MIQAKHISTCERLEAEGWTFDHTATVSIYAPAGSISKMQTRKGYDYCRVNQGRCVGQHCWQVATVYRREVGAVMVG